MDHSANTTFFQQSLPCFLDLPQSYLPKAQYALEMLLLPLQLKPLWIQKDEIAQSPCLVYSTQKSSSNSTVYLQFDPSTADFFEESQPATLHYQTLQTEFGEIPIMFGGDVIASAFFWLSDWQTKRIKERDIHGRFLYQHSVQKNIGYDAFPFVDVYRKIIHDELERIGVQTTMRKWGDKDYSFCISHDIDHIRKWTVAKMIYGVANRLNRKNKSAKNIPREGTKVRNSFKDPYRIGLYNMTALAKRKGFQPTWFLKAGKTARQDSYYSLQKKSLQNLMQEWIDNGHEIGLHPSYFGHTRFDTLNFERKKLSKFLGKRVNCIRQHYLRHDTTITPFLQEKATFKVDSTIGFIDKVGFRNGTCFPFKIFDLVENKARDLWEIPLAIHDTTLFQYQNLTLLEAIKETEEVMQWVSRFGGVGVFLWHNVIYDEHSYPQWVDHYKYFANKIIQSGAVATTLSKSLKLWTEKPH